MTFNRRDIFKLGLGATAGSLIFNPSLFGEEDRPNPRSQKFLLYVHFASGCGAANGLIQPMKAGSWPKGFFAGGSNGGSLNKHLNKHTASGSLVFHDYLKPLLEISEDLCLVNGNPRSLDHTVAASYQKRGGPIPTFAPEWAMGVTQFMRSDQNRNPMIISSGSKTSSVADVTSLATFGLNDFRKVTRDAAEVPGGAQVSIWNALAERYKSASLNDVDIEAGLGLNVENQLSILQKGLPALDANQAKIDELAASLQDDVVFRNIERIACPDRDGIRSRFSGGFRDSLILAGALAKAGLANGMSIGLDMGDLHNGGSCVATPRQAAGAWMQIVQLWKWIKAMGLQDDFMIVVGQEFARSPFNDSFSPVRYIDPEGKDVEINSPGRDHGTCMGMIFINGKVPRAGRVGNVTDNMTPVAGMGNNGSIDPDGKAYVSENIIGSMLMRAFDDLFPTERMVRKHWPTFVPIPSILDGK